jgi:low temperature requirement protein LtrA
MARLPLRQRHDRPDVVAGSVTTVELFFDLVFVFTITQLTATLGHAPGWTGVGRVTLLLVLMWWMYGGYAWLTNAAPPVTAVRRASLLLGMVGNFMMALAVPHAFTTDRLVFALGYLLVVAVHTTMYLSQSGRVTPGMVVQLAMFNGLAAALVLVGALLDGDAVWVLWVAAVLVETLLPKVAARTVLRDIDSGPAFTLHAAHFVERHGLMLIIVLGESVLAIGVGVSSGVATIGTAQVFFAAVSLALAFSLFWAYFGTGEDHAAEESLETAPADRQQAVALTSYGYAFGVILLAVVFASSGLHHALPHPTRHLDLAWATQLAGGVAAFWVGLALFRLAIGRRDVALRMTGGLLLLVAIPAGTLVSGLVELLVLLAGSVAVLVVERTPLRSA